MSFNIQRHIYTSVISWCGRWGHGHKGCKLAQSWNKIQTLKEHFCCHIYCAHLGTPWYKIVGAFRAVSITESRYPRGGVVPHPSLFLRVPKNCRNFWPTLILTTTTSMWAVVVLVTLFILDCYSLYFWIPGDNLALPKLVRTHRS